MINSHFTLNVRDYHLFKEMRESVVYRDYVKDIVNSPMYRSIAQDNIDAVDITEDIRKLMSDTKLTPSDLNKIFKDTLRKMALGLMTDAVLLKELADVSVDDVKKELDSDFKIKYLLGMADKRYYEEAEKKLRKDPDTSSILYRGLIEYYKRTGKLETETENESNLVTLDKTTVAPKKMESKRESSHNIDIESDEVAL